MTVSRLIDAFAKHELLPVEIHDVRDAIVEYSPQDEVRLIREDMDLDVLRAVFYQYREPTGVYAPPKNVSLVIYNGRLSLPWQRVACCKELIHVLDGPADRTSKPEDVEGLLDRLMKPVPADAFGPTDFMAARDQIALFQAIAVLAPEASMQPARELLYNDKTTVESISRWACLPEEAITLVMSNFWDSVRTEISRC